MPWERERTEDVSQDGSAGTVAVTLSCSEATARLGLPASSFTKTEADPVSHPIFRGAGRGNGFPNTHRARSEHARRASPSPTDASLPQPAIGIEKRAGP